MAITMVESVSPVVVTVALLITIPLISAFVLPLLSQKSKYIHSQPWIGLQKGWFPHFRTGVEAVTKTREMLAEGYEKFSKSGKPFVLAQMGRDPFLILPAANVHEFLTSGDDKVDNHTVGAESIAARWTMGKLFNDESHFDVVRRQLTRRLPLLTADVYEELVFAMQEQWPCKTEEWTTVKTYPTCMKIVSRAANRVFSGKDLCRNPEYLEHSRMYAMAVFKSGALLKMVPKYLKDIVALYLMREVNHHSEICRRISLPIVKARLQQMQQQGKNYEPANDVLQWVLDDAILADKSYRRDPEWICRFLLMLNMVAIHTTSMVMSNTLLDLYSSPDVDEVVAGLREESHRIHKEYDGQWSKNAVNSLLRLDSTIRETMRFSGLGDLGLPRLVSDPKGLDLSGGIHIPPGVRVAVNSYGIHHDDAHYSNAMQWDAFRFSRPQEAYNEAQQAQKERAADHLEKVLDFKNRGMIVTTDDFFSFGFGKHACPGRFFASQEMKLMLAHIVMNYDIKIDGGRPKNMQIGGSYVPTEQAEIQIRLRRA